MSGLGFYNWAPPPGIEREYFDRVEEDADTGGWTCPRCEKHHRLYELHRAHYDACVNRGEQWRAVVFRQGSGLRNV